MLLVFSKNGVILLYVPAATEEQMNNPDTTELNLLGKQLMEFYPQLLSLARRNLNPILAKRITAEDIVQDTISAASLKTEYLNNNPEVPLYFKLRMILFQTITAMERKHLQCGKRDAYKEVEVSDDQTSAVQANWNMFADSVTSPRSKLAKRDRNELLRKIILELSDTDRVILELRHLDGMGNNECAFVLKIEPKAASIRYVRALKKLQSKLLEYSEFR